ncbi:MULTISPECIES: hypothetical protein [unclassified Streptomyces]|uniref:hypothetical protein n=1 Tax=unclassified Streptomyces TaxID=2593676 RepID=UPI002DDB319F|nr:MULTISPECIES: hypothetical protein [unclassified Streptomyces]WSA94031.1 hypothetical protein OIE63_22455 [Streptomyces sp. NBC_01795]WSB78456.1 hypothetical protein OHB04_23585 [Streptomyces sp. NBC_01775]WSS13344.1 hypothetical protein OG533_16660 [Streptomyces sp. NBC_01186]WSS42131.1 hypothetical protein OG220_17215 [Streptomyces sp. NBC_01187]
MKSRRSRLVLGLATAAAAIAIPLTATTASAATPPPGDGWQEVGGESFDSWQACYDQMQSDLPLNPKYHEATCTSNPQPGLPNFYSEWMR